MDPAITFIQESASPIIYLLGTKASCEAIKVAYNDHQSQKKYPYKNMLINSSD